MSTVRNVASDEALTKDAYARVKGDWATLKPEQLLQVNLEVHFASELALGAWRKMKTFREQIVRELPTFDVAQFDKLEDYTLALRYVQSRYAMAVKGPNSLEDLVQQANKLNDMLEADARALALRGLFDAQKLQSLTGGNSYKGLADDLEALANELEAIFPTIEGKCAVTREDLTAATQMATRLTRRLGEQQVSPEAVAALAEERQRAFTQFIRTYEDARSALGFLRRREDDLDTLAPNLYAGNARRRKPKDTAPVISPGTPQPSTPGASGAALGEPAAGTSLAGNGAAPTSPSTAQPFVS